MGTDLDLLMDIDPLALTKSDLDAIISYHRSNRAKEGADGKMPRGKRTAPSAEKTKMNLADLLNNMKPKAAAPAPASTPAPTKPTSGGMRRV